MSSRLLSALRYEQLEMPPAGKLKPEVIADFEHWIAAGAPDPRLESSANGRADTGSAAGGKSLPSPERPWSFQPVQCVPPPPGTPWSESNIDKYCEAIWQAQHVAPARDASPSQLIRRLFLDLTGLPPTPEELQTWLDSGIEVHWERLVDHLLASPRFGERWGRHWLDVARFAESTGGGRSLILPDAWRYRDFVVDAINRDMPISQFILEQIAGDLLPHQNDAEFDRHHIAVGYLALGAINYELQDKEQLRMEVVDEQMEAIGRGLLGLSLGCARCHDHKFDPIPTQDYYALAGIFTSTQLLVPGNVSGFVTVPLKTATPAVPAEAQPQQKTAPNKPSDSPPLAMCVVDQPDPQDTHLLLRGEVRRLGPVIPRGFLSAVPSTTLPQPRITQTSGRRELAAWITSPQNPLTARVFANRVWHHLLGRGIVVTPDDFGNTGERPTHPELLDYLAHSLIHEDHWSLKQLVRRIVTSHVYRLSTEVSPEIAEADPRNRWLTHAHRRQLDAEALRDTLLDTSGQLDFAMGGLTIERISTYDWDYQFRTQRRSLYVPRFRSAPLDLFERFDVANPNVATGMRTQSILPTQALYFMNSPFIWSCADRAAAALAHEDSVETRIQQVYQRLLGRPAQKEEIQIAHDLLHERGDQASSWSALCQLVYSSLEFRLMP